MSADDSSDAAPPPVQCALCGAVADTMPLTWTTSVERGRTMLYCDTCGRDNLRAIEGRLDSEWF
jgi:hypothetical protein